MSADDVKPGQRWQVAQVDTPRGQFRVMAVAEGYAMCRFKGCVPHVRRVIEMLITCTLVGPLPKERA